MDQGAPEVLSGADNRDRSRDPRAREHLVVRHTQWVVNDARISQQSLVRGRAAPTTRRPSSSLITEPGRRQPTAGRRRRFPSHSDAKRSRDLVTSDLLCATSTTPPPSAISSVEDPLQAPGACDSIGCKQTVSPMNGSVGRTRRLCWSGTAAELRRRDRHDAAHARQSRSDRARRRRFRVGRIAEACGCGRRSSARPRKQRPASRPADHPFRTTWATRDAQSGVPLTKEQEQAKKMARPSRGSGNRVL
jgi:hypothetical protein